MSKSDQFAYKVVLTEASDAHLKVLMSTLGFRTAAEVFRYLLAQSILSTYKYSPAPSVVQPVVSANEPEYPEVPTSTQIAECRFKTYADYSRECRTTGFERKHGMLNEVDWAYCTQLGIDSPTGTALQDFWSDLAAKPWKKEECPARKVLELRDGKPWTPIGA